MGVVLAITSIPFILVIFLTIQKLYLIVMMKWDRSPTCLVGKTAIVTGANTGIGFETAQDFAKRGARVILACRDPKRADEARAKIVKATKNPNVVVKIVDLASLSSVRKFAAQINATEERLDILVNNAGIGTFGDVITEDGLNMLMQTNHFGPFLLTLLLIGINPFGALLSTFYDSHLNILINLLKRSVPSRIVILSSLHAHDPRIDLNQLNVVDNGIFKTFLSYGTSKLCNIIFSNELARRLKGTGVCVNSLHPGPVKTDIYRHFTGVPGIIGGIIVKYFYKSVQEGAQTSIYVAVSNEIDGISGQFFADCRKGYMLPKARDEQLARKVWEKSEEAVKLTADEKVLN